LHSLLKIQWAAHDAGATSQENCNEPGANRRLMLLVTDARMRFGAAVSYEAQALSYPDLARFAAAVLALLPWE
jgi:hypothetical protein